MSQAETTNRPLMPAELASLPESRPPYHPQRELERLRAAIARHRAARQQQPLNKITCGECMSAWERDMELYMATLETLE